MKTRIALIEDSFTLRRSFLASIADHPEVDLVLTAVNGQDFLVKMAKIEADKQPQVVLTDIEMEVMDGIETVAIGKIKYPHLHFVMLTVFDNEKKLFAAVQAGAIGYLLKDEPIEKVVDAVFQALDGGVPMSALIARKTLDFMCRPGASGLPETKSQPDARALPVISHANEQLSGREMEILEQVVLGLTYQQIALKLFISPHTVRTHIQHIYDKLQVNSKIGAIRTAIDKKWFGL